MHIAPPWEIASAKHIRIEQNLLLFGKHLTAYMKKFQTPSLIIFNTNYTATINPLQSNINHAKGILTCDIVAINRSEATLTSTRGATSCFLAILPTELEELLHITEEVEEVMGLDIVLLERAEMVGSDAEVAADA